MKGWIVSSNKDTTEYYFRSYSLTVDAVAEMIQKHHIPKIRRDKLDVSINIRFDALSYIDTEKLVQAIVEDWKGGHLTTFLDDYCPELHHQIKEAIERQNRGT